ncbi:alpha/beta hydrolase [Streptomyces chiangmaiensis]|uniref:Alpha/beta hydrolase n=1 Tax=Streptomyces chiangmaiensis TaxID=766497 RepID=A0ABU7FMG6_9ACTN|nr:alpha/beta hydrolase [Streptomyces chiangmaiensis]MED7825130.1 alpha/beta hydrolase [Streptomyces chiangmaiensis]
MLSTHARIAVTTATATTAVLALLGAALPSVTEADGGPDLSRFYRQRIAWSACSGEEKSGDLQCGKVTVPLDYARPKAGTLDLAMARYRATAGSHGSVLLNFGGPGGAGVPELAAGGKNFMHLTNGYDVVTFDPRGVGQSSPVSCGLGTAEESNAPENAVDASDPRAALEQIRRTAERCAGHSGPVLPHMGTVDAARDLDVMRQALGDKKLNYLGFSYGTRLGAVYAAQFPTKVGRMVLDGVDTLTESLAEQGLAGAQGQQTALEDFLDSCVKHLLCPFGEDARSAREQIVQLIDSLDREPASTTLGQPFSGQDLVAAMSELLFSERMWPMLEQGLSQLVEGGDPSGLMRYSGAGIAAPSGHRAGGGIVDREDVPIDNLSAALMAVNCADDPDRPSADRVTRDLARLRGQYQVASPVFGRYRLTQVLMCYGRPKGTDFIREKVKNVRSAKMLLVGTRGDPATPYRWALETAKRLGPSAVVLDNRGEGHTGYTTSQCVHRKVDSFLLYGSLPADGSSCGPDPAG